MLEELPGHSLTDDLLFLKAGIKKETGEILESSAILLLIAQDHADGLLGAKAYYELGILYEDYLDDSEMAISIYTDFLKKYPGSIYTTDVRKRLRVLRGDSIYVEEPELN